MGRGLAEGPVLGDGVGLGVAVGVAVAVGVGVGVDPPAGAWIATSHWRPCLEEAYCRVGSLRRLIGIKPEVIQCAKANRVSVLILRKGFAVPSDRSIAF